MKKFLAIAILLLLALSSAEATHIVGGEMGLEHKSNSYARLYLNLYFDVRNGNPGANDPAVTVSIFQKNGNIRIMDINLPKKAEMPVPYSDPDCARGDLITSLIIYDDEIYLDPNIFTHPQGYYVSWQRCCRNNIISNIINPQNTGMVFYAEFPAIVYNNAGFINSSPKINPVSGDYLCVGQEYSFSFGATDADGDQLVYSLVTPLQGTSSASEIAPVGVPGPYLGVFWAPGFNADNAVPGVSPAFGIDVATGLLRVRPDQQGLFVFSVKVEEFRGGRKIGEVRRDFQWKVLDICSNDPPELALELPGGGIYVEGDTIVITSSETLCSDFLATDTPGSRLNFSLKAVNYNNPVLTLSPASGEINNLGDVLRSNFCWPDCSISREEPYIFDVQVSDDGCPLPLQATVRVTLLVRPDPNAVPEISTSLTGNTVYMIMGDSVSFDVTGTDSDNDLLTLSFEGTDFEPSSLGMQFEGGTGQGTVTSPFYWKPECEVLNREMPLRVIFRVKDNSCYSTNVDTTSVLFYIEDLDNKEEEFIPANVFTPNGDGINDIFTFPTLPLDNCASTFDNIKVFNRWGRKVFEGQSRDSGWDGKNMPEGIYYYLVKYSNRTYKGTVTILK